MKYQRNDAILDLFLQEMRRRLGAHLRQVILFGSRARGDAAPDSDYDCLAVLDEVSPALTDIIDDIAGEILYQYDAVFSVFPISEEKHRRQRYVPFLMNVRREGITL
jgi:predicted nucleotidyltransferase